MRDDLIWFGLLFAFGVSLLGLALTEWRNARALRELEAERQREQSEAQALADEHWAEIARQAIREVEQLIAEKK